MHRLITPDCSTCRLKTEEPESGIDAPFDEPMVLLDEVVEIFTPPQLSAVGKGSFFLQLLGRQRIGWILIDVDHSRRRMRCDLEHLAEEPFGGLRVSFRAQHE